MSVYKIVAINKDNGNHDNPHEAIRAYIYELPNGDQYYLYRQDMVDKIKQGSTAYAHSEKYDDAWCEVRSNGRIEFLQTVSDGKYSNNLLALPEQKIKE